MTQLEQVEDQFDRIGENINPEEGPIQTGAVFGRMCAWAADSRQHG
jgi:hypothetical protein